MASPVKSKPSIRVVVAVSRDRPRKALKALLSTYENIEVIAEASSGSDAVALTEQYHPDVILLDASMPEMSGIEAAGHIRKCWSEIAVIVIASHEDSATEARAAGADTFLFKDKSIDELVSMIRRVEQEPSC